MLLCLFVCFPRCLPLIGAQDATELTVPKVAVLRPTRRSSARLVASMKSAQGFGNEALRAAEASHELPKSVRGWGQRWGRAPDAVTMLCHSKGLAGQWGGTVTAHPLSANSAGRWAVTPPNDPDYMLRRPSFLKT